MKMARASRRVPAGMRRISLGDEPPKGQRLRVGFDIRGGVFRDNTLYDAQTDSLWMTALAERMHGLRQRPDYSFCPAVEPSPAPILGSQGTLARLGVSVGHPSSSIRCR